MAEQLTKQQKKAVDDRGGALLVSAAAGSGKTKVLVDRVMKYITDPNDPVNIDDFLIITYTKAAASELRAKIAKALTQRISEDPSNMRLQQQFRRHAVSRPQGAGKRAVIDFPMTAGRTLLFQNSGITAQ